MNETIAQTDKRKRLFPLRKFCAVVWVFIALLGSVYQLDTYSPLLSVVLGVSCRITLLFADFRPKARTRLAIPTDSLGVFGDRVWRRLTNRIQSSQLPVRAAAVRNTSPSVRQDERIYGSRYTRDFPCIG